MFSATEEQENWRTPDPSEGWETPDPSEGWETPEPSWPESEANEDRDIFLISWALGLDREQP